MKKQDMISSTIAEKIFGSTVKSSGTRTVSYVNTGRCEVCHPSLEFVCSLINEQEFKKPLDDFVRTFDIDKKVFYWIDQYFFSSGKWEKQSKLLKDFYAKLVRSADTILYDPTTREIIHNSVNSSKPILKSK